MKTVSLCGYQLKHKIGVNEKMSLSYFKGCVITLRATCHQTNQCVLVGKDRSCLLGLWMLLKCFYQKVGMSKIPTT